MTWVNGCRHLVSARSHCLHRPSQSRFYHNGIIVVHGRVCSSVDRRFLSGDRLFVLLYDRSAVLYRNKLIPSQRHGAGRYHDSLEPNDWTCSLSDLTCLRYDRVTATITPPRPQQFDIHNCIVLRHITEIGFTKFILHRNVCVKHTHTHTHAGIHTYMHTQSFKDI